MLARQVAATLAAAAIVAGPIASAAGSDMLACCKSDVARLCPGVEPGGGRIIGCLKAHTMEVSVGCAKAIQGMKAKMGKSADEGPPLFTFIRWKDKPRRVRRASGRRRVRSCLQKSSVLGTQVRP